jgi:hypothetical protein
MGFSRWAHGDASIAPEGGGDQEKMESSSLPHDPSPTEIDSHIGASTSLGTTPSTADQDSRIEAYGSLWTAPSRRIYQHSLPHVATTTPSTSIVERSSTTWIINYRAFAEQMDAVIKASSAAKVTPFAEVIAEKVLWQ